MGRRSTGIIALVRCRCYLLFHSSDETVIENYENSFNALLHDEQAYNVLFGKDFPFEELIDNND